jgi:hypothetical protein
MFFRKTKEIHHLKQDILDLEARINGMKYNARMIQINIDDQFPGLFLAPKNYVASSKILKTIYCDIGLIK